MSWLRFRSERAKTATVVGVTFIFLPLILFAVFSVVPGGGILIAFLIAYALEEGSVPWIVWLPPLIGILFLARAVVDEVRARRDDDY